MNASKCNPARKKTDTSDIGIIHRYKETKYVSAYFRQMGVWSDVYGFSATPVEPKRVQQGIRKKNNTIIITTIEVSTQGRILFKLLFIISFDRMPYI